MGVLQKGHPPPPVGFSACPVMVTQVLGLMSDQPRLPRAEVPPASPPWAVGPRSGVGLGSVLGLQAERFQRRLGEAVSRPLGQVLSEACPSGNRLCLPALQGSWGSTPWTVSASAWRSTVQSGLGDVRLMPPVEDGSRLDSTLSPRSRPSPLSSALAVPWSGPGGSEVRAQICFPSWPSPPGAGIAHH